LSDQHSVSTDKSLLNVELIHDFLSNRSYWAKGRTIEEVKATIANSICFGLYFKDEQVGFCRVVSDKVAFAYVMDFFIVDSHRGKGLSKVLTEEMLAHPDLLSVNWLLATKDAHNLYRKYGFSEIDNAHRYMKKTGAIDS